MDVFSNFYLMRDICGLNCNLNNNECSKAGLWDVLKLRIQPGQQVDSNIIILCAIKGTLPFIEWMTDKK